MTNETFLRFYLIFYILCISAHEMRLFHELKQVLLAGKVEHAEYEQKSRQPKELITLNEKTSCIDH